MIDRLDDFQAACSRTARTYKDPARALAVMGLGVAGEAGEVADLIKKVIGHDHDLDVIKVRAELGDVLFYVAAIADLVGLSLSEVAQANIDKLFQRYPNGFDPERSKNRSV